MTVKRIATSTQNEGEKEPVKKLVGLVALLLTVLVLSACGSDGASGSSSPEKSAEAAFNDADVTFAQGMIPHHRQAIEMAQLAKDRAESIEVKDLATKIEAAQAPEIEQLSTWLEQWGEDVPTGGTDDEGMSGMDHGSGDMSMGGMMSEEDMGMLEGASGADFDRMFLEMMIEHHGGAIEMAQTEVDEGAHRGAIAMAEEIISTQQAEIDTMEQLLQQS
jgi:uncharacterized protein (DUF305 family)